MSELVARCPKCRRPTGTITTTAGRASWTPTAVGESLGELELDLEAGHVQSGSARAVARHRLADDVLAADFYGYDDFPRGGIPVADLEHADGVLVGWCAEHGDVEHATAELIARTRPNTATAAR